MTRIRLIVQALRGGSLRRATGILGGGAVVSLVLTYATQVVLTRLFSPSDFGIADSFISLVAILSPIASLRYEDAIMLPETRRESRTVLQLSFALTVLSSAAVLAVTIPFGHWIGSKMGSAVLGAYLPLLAAAILLHRSNELLELWSTRSKQFVRISSAQVVRTSTTSVVRLLSGASSTLANAGGLIWGFIIGFLSSTLILVRRSDPDTPLLRDDWDRTSLRNAANRYRRFPTFTMPANLLGSLNSRLPFLLLLFFFSPDVVGLYGRAFVAVAIPLSVVGIAISRVFFVAASERVRSGGLAGLSAAVHDRLVSVAMLPVAALLVAGPQLFGVIFGNEWTTAGHYAQILTPWFALAGIASPLTRLFDVRERQKLDLGVSAGSFVLVSAALITGGRSQDIWLTLWLVGWAGIVARILQLSILLSIGGVRLSAALVPYFKYAAAATPLASILFLSRDSGPATLLIALTVGLVIYAAVIAAIELKRTAAFKTPDGDENQLQN